MATFESLPNEIVYQIAEMLHYSPLWSLALTSTRLHRLCETLVVTRRRELLRDYAWFRDTTRHSRRTPNWHNNRRWPWHRLLILCLTHQFPPTFVLDLHLPDYIRTGGNGPLASRPALDALPSQCVSHYDQIIARAVQSSQWIDIEDKSEHTRSILAGNEDATLAILLPYFTNLRKLSAPYSSWRTTEVFRRISCAHAAQPCAYEAAVELPFAKLTLIWTTPTDAEYAWPLSELRAYLGLPNLRRVIIHGAREQTTKELPPMDVAPSSCPEVFISGGSVSRQVITEMAKMWKTPVIFRQLRSSPGYRCMAGRRESNWDHCELIGNEVVLSLKGSGRADATDATERNAADTSGLAQWALDLANGKLHDWRLLSAL